MIPWPFIISFVVVAAGLWVAHRLVLPPEKMLPPDRKLPRILLMAGLILTGAFILIVFLPVSNEVEVQILAVVGIVLSGAIAVASTSIMSNAMAGLLIRLNRPFDVGDYIQVEDHAGRVSERGLFDTEIQTVERELISLPNSYLINTPVSVISGERAIVSASINVPGSEDVAVVEELLKQAALDAGLADPFILIISLNPVDVHYRVSGFLTDDSRLIAKRSSLNRTILVNLTKAGIAVSQSRPIGIQQHEAFPARNAPPQARTIATTQDADIDDLLFEKATNAERVEQVTLRIDELHTKLESLEGEDANRLQARIDRLQRLLDETPQA